MNVRRFALWIILTSVPLVAQTTVTWIQASATALDYPTNGGYISASNSYDTLSGQFVEWVQHRFTGTVNATNGSNQLTLASGDQFSSVWHYPNQFKVCTSSASNCLTSSATNVTIASATPPSNCTGSGIPPVNCLTVTMSSNWTGSTGTYQYQTSKDASIYSDTWGYYNDVTDTWTYGPGWGSLDSQCFGNSTVYNLPDMRQNNGMFVIDTVLHRSYIWGGVNNSCNPTVITNGTSTVTTSNPNCTAGGLACFVQGSIWLQTGYNISFGSGAESGLCSPVGSVTCYTVASVNSESNITINCGGSYPACPNLGTGPATIRTPDMPYGGNFKQDMSYLQLNANPASNTVTLLPSNNTYQSAWNTKNDSGSAYDSADGGIVSWGIQNNNTFVFCSGDNNGGTLTTAQTAMGCSASNVWNQVTASTSPPGTYSPSMVYDPAWHRIWEFGGEIGYGSGVTQTDVWQWCPTASAGCGSRGWSALSSTNQPSQRSYTGVQPAEWTLDTIHDVVYTHNSAVTNGADYYYTPSTNSWTQMTTTGSSVPWTTGITTGTAYSTGVTIGFDPVNVQMVAIGQAIVGSGQLSYVWLGALSGFGGPPTYTNSGGGTVTSSRGGIN